jgi:hypothetical protein
MRNYRNETEDHFKDNLIDILRSNEINILRRDLKVFFIDNNMQIYLDDNLPRTDEINIQISKFEDTVKSIE